MKVLVTGATGFVGNALCRALCEGGFGVARALRTAAPALPQVQDFVLGDFGADTPWDMPLRGVDAVVHLAARTHVMRDTDAAPLAAYRRINVDATRALADAAGKARVRRLLYLSSVKVNGEHTTTRPFCENDTPQPLDDYGLSKWEAEQTLHASATASGMEATVLRVPLLYGPGAKGNMLRLMHAVAHGIPLPFGSLANRRSLLGIDNLVHAILTCVSHPAAGGQTYLAGDGEDVSTPHLIRLIANALHRPARLLPCPSSLLRIAGKLTGRDAAVTRVVSSLQIDTGRIRRELGFQPVLPLAEGLARMAQWYDRQSSPDMRN